MVAECRFFCHGTGLALNYYNIFVTAGIDLKLLQIDSPYRVAIKNGQEHCLTSSERGDRSIQSGRVELF